MSSHDDEDTEVPAFDLFATEVEDNLSKELAKGSFQWTNKYTKYFSYLLIGTTLVAAGIWYGHDYTTNQVTTSAQSLRSAFGGSGNGGFSATGALPTGVTLGGGGGFGGGGFGGTRVSGTITSVTGSTVTITLTDPTQVAALKAGDTARITDTAGAGAGVNAGGATAGGVNAGGATAGGVTPGPATPGGVNAGGSKPGNSGLKKKKVPNASPTTTSAPAAGNTAGGLGAPSGAAPTVTGNGAGPGNDAGPGNGAGRRGGLFSNPALLTCLTKAGITIQPGQRPDFQDPATQNAMTKCMSELGIAAPGAGGGFGAGGRQGGNGANPAPAPSGAATP